MAVTSGITLIQKLQKLFGARAVSDMMGRTTNVQTLAQGTNNPFARQFSKKYLAKNPDGVDEAAESILSNMQFAFGNKNIQQMKNFEANVDTLYDLKFPPKPGEAKVVDIGTKKQVTGEGLESLKDDLGLPVDVPPTSPLGQSITKAKREDMGTGVKTKNFFDFESGTDVMKEARRRPIIRQILAEDKAFRKNLTSEDYDDLLFGKDLDKGGDPNKDPLAYLNRYFERDTDQLEILDGIIDNMQGETPAKISAEFKKRTGGLKLKKTKTVEDFADEGDFDPGGMAQGGRAGFNVGGLSRLLKFLQGKVGKKNITTADKIDRPESALNRDMFKEFNERVARKTLNVPETPPGFKLSRERLLKNYPEIDEDFADQIMVMDRNMQIRIIEMLKNRRENPKAYDKLLMEKGDTLDFQGEFDRSVKRGKNAQGGIAGQLHMNEGGSVTTPKRGLVNEAGSYAGVKKVREGKTYDVISSQLLDPTFDLMDLDELRDILKSLGLNYKTGGRVGLQKGGPPNPGRRNFMKLMAGLASIPVLGKFFKPAAKVAKVVPIKNASTAMPTWFPDFVDKFISKGVGNKIDADLMEFKNPDLPNVKVTKHDDGRVYVEGNNEFNEGYSIEYKPPGYEVIDEKTGKAVKTQGDFEAVEGRHVALGPEDYDTDPFYVEDLDELTTIDVAEMEKYTTGKVTKTVKDAFGEDTGLKKGTRNYEMAVGKAENEADILRDADLLDEDLATGGRVGLLSGGGVLKAMLKSLAKERGVTPSYLLEVMNYKALPTKIKNLMSRKQFEELKNARLKQVKNFRDMMESRLQFNESIQQGKAIDDKGTGMSKIFDILEEDFGKTSAVPKNVTEKDILQMEQMIKNIETKGRKPEELNAKGGLAGQLKL